MKKEAALTASLRLLFAAALLAPVSALAAAPPTTLSGPADVGRMQQREENAPPPPVSNAPETAPPLFPAIAAPEQSKHVTLTLKEVRVTGMTVFTPAAIEDIYAPYIGKKITLDTVWALATKVTQRYRDAGYFLSRVAVPQQEIEDGIIHLRVIEGYIGDIQFDNDLAQNRIVGDWLDRLKSLRPLKAGQLENVLLSLNDLPGVNLHAVLEPLPAAEGGDGAVRLVLEPRPQNSVSGVIGFDNNGSRFLGPYEAQAQMQAVIIPTQRTTVALLSSLPWKKVKYASLKHELPLFEGGTLELYGSYTTAVPGYTLQPYDIRSHSTIYGTAIDYSIIRQRQQNLSGRVAFEAQDTEADILDTPLTRDYVRALRFGLTYQLADIWNGQNAVTGTLSQGVAILGASPQGQENLSRSEAKPNFTKFNLDASRLQGVTQDWSVFLATAAQVASGPLYSSEQFGYGGQVFGRAYDDSEITGDNGINAAGELRYGGLSPWLGLQPVPYGFYDTGAVWNDDPSQGIYAAGSSAGAGFRMLSDFGFSSNFGIAFPLTHIIANPIYGNSKNPRYFLQVSYAF
ncbi:MAG: ShlB/FhaC/HecB family hemolysin secretion/activation protein [Alphaproteobacteria bacterium]|nr:ShlB/FhaC/HecB family hemolysin secretion/activation protein [Alphaproteobacteria bacterium]